MNSANLQLCFDESHIKLPERSYVTHCDLETKSILKPPKARAPLQEVDFGLNQSIDPDVIRKRRVSFAGVNIIKEFHSKAESVIICSTPAYEETFSTSSDSSALTSTSAGASSCGDDCTLLNDTMDLTDAAIDRDFNAQMQNEKKDYQGSGQEGIFSNSPTFLSSAPGTVKMQNVTMNRGGADHLTNAPVQQNKHPNSDPARLLVNALLEVSNIPEDSSINNSLISNKNENESPINNEFFNPTDRAAERENEKSLTDCSRMEFHDTLPQHSAFPDDKSDHFSNANNMSISGMEFTEAIPNILVQARHNLNESIPQSHRKNTSSNINKMEMELTEVIPRILNQGENVNYLTETVESNNETKVQFEGLNCVTNQKINIDSSQTMDFTEVLQPQRIEFDKGAIGHDKRNIPPLQGNYSFNSSSTNNFIPLQMELTQAHGFSSNDQNQKDIATHFVPDNRGENYLNDQQDMETSLMECTEAVPNQYRYDHYLDSERNQPVKSIVPSALPNESFDMEITEAIPKRQSNPSGNPSKNQPITLMSENRGTFFSDFSQDANHSQSKMEFTEAVPSLFSKERYFQEREIVRPNISHSQFVHPNNTFTEVSSPNFSQETRRQQPIETRSQQPIQDFSNNETLMDFTEAVPQVRLNSNFPPFTCQKSAKGHNTVNETLMELTEALPTCRGFTNRNRDFNQGNRNSPLPNSSTSDLLESNSFRNMSPTNLNKINVSSAQTSSKIEHTEIRPYKETAEKSNTTAPTPENNTSPVKNDSPRAYTLTRSPPEIPVFSQANNSQIDFTDMLPVVKERNVSHLRKQLTFSMTMKKDEENTQMDFTDTVLSRKYIQGDGLSDKNAELDINETEASGNAHKSEFKTGQSTSDVLPNECKNLKDNSCQQFFNSNPVSPAKENSLNITNVVETEEKVVTEKSSPHSSSEGYGSIQEDIEIPSISSTITAPKYIESEFISSNEPSPPQKDGDCNEEAHCEEFNMSVDVSFNLLEDINEKALSQFQSDYERMGNQQYRINLLKENNFPSNSDQIICNGVQSSEATVVPSVIGNHVVKTGTELHKSRFVNSTECLSTSSQAPFTSNCFNKNSDFNEKREASKNIFSDEDKWQLIKRNRSFMNTISFSFVSYIRWKRSLPWPVDIIIQIPFVELNVNTEIHKVKLESKITKKDKMGYLADYCMTKNMNLLLSENWLNSECKTIKDLLVAIRLVEDEYNFLQPLLSNLKFMYIKTYWIFKDNQLVIPFISSRKKYYFEIHINVSNYKKLSEKDVHIINHVGKVSRDVVQTSFKNFLPFSRTEDRLWLFTQAIKELVDAK